MSTVTISGEVFRWARERVGFSDENLAQSMHIKPEIISAWETGREYPNFSQAQKLANILSVPLGYLFLSHPPEIILSIADFRTFPGKPHQAISPNLQDLLDDSLRKRDWYSEWRKSENLPPFDFVGKYTLLSNPEQIVQDMRTVLEITSSFTANIKSWDEHLRNFVFRVESAGILVLQSGIVGNNTHRKLSLEEFRGFTLADKFAPLIFLNAQDSIAARVFTLAHELTHIWTGTSGISNSEIVPGFEEHQQVENFCNLIAANFLVPNDIFIDHWNKSRSIIDNIQYLANFFRVSSQVILRRSFELGIIQIEEYFQIYQEIIKSIKPRSKNDGGNFYNSFFCRNSRRFTKTVVNALTSGKLSYHEAARFLNIQPNKISAVIERLR
jgi:Zn-dependent peptidase ImmA (M78 family)/DNA-binding XRE family transcriptional regulator